MRLTKTCLQSGLKKKYHALYEVNEIMILTIMRFLDVTGILIPRYQQFLDSVFTVKNNEVNV